MVSIEFFGMTLTADFTAPAWLALLSLTLPYDVLMQTVTAALLHEFAHFAAMLFMHQKPESLRFSAIGLCIHMKGDAICPLPALCTVLCAGAAANLIASGCLYRIGCIAAARTNLSLALLNLLPYSGTDGGSMLEALLSFRFIDTAPERIRSIQNIVCITVSLLLTAGLLAARICNISIWGMMVFLTGSQFASEQKKAGGLRHPKA